MNVRAERTNFDPEKIRRLLAQQYGQVEEATAQPESAGLKAGGPHGGQELLPHFELKPEELIAYLDQYVVKQEHAKAILATKICTHFNRLNLPPDGEEDIVGSIKNNVLMIGPTGVGKTYLIKLIARRLGVPFVKADATKFSETGYVGGDVEDLVRELVHEADGDISRAEHGIVYIDEIDKIASARTSVGPDVSRSGVQRNLLKLMEETEVDLKSPHDIASQMESVMQMQRTGKIERQKINTRNILFVVSGAFAGLEELVARRLNRGSMGFQCRAGTRADNHLLGQVRAEDLIEYGFESEFIGRLPVVAVLDELDCEDLLEILRSPKSSVILSKKRDFRAYGIEIEFTDEALQILARRAYAEHTGARGLVGAIERALLIFETRLPSTAIDHFSAGAQLIENPEAALEQLLFEYSLQAFVDRFFASHGIRLHFGEDSRGLVRQMARQQNLVPDELCHRLLADYGHGLKLMERDRFELTPEILRHPQESLNRLIKEFYAHRG